MLDTRFVAVYDDAFVGILQHAGQRYNDVLIILFCLVNAARPQCAAVNIAINPHIERLYQRRGVFIVESRDLKGVIAICKPRDAVFELLHGFLPLDGNDDFAVADDTLLGVVAIHQEARDKRSFIA